MSLNRAWIEEHIPHQGRMCLLDEVLEWDARHIRCRSSTHRVPDNPLRSHGRLGAVCGIEYAAQAMALHGALAGGALAGGAPAAMAGAPEMGFLASVRDMRLFVLRLDDIASDLMCEVTLVAGNGPTALYEFALSEGQRTLMTGRATVVLDAGKRLGP
jgi:predicted hotdog family 3-hydroxylacyl-ACP dehydratase